MAERKGKGGKSPKGPMTAAERAAAPGAPYDPAVEAAGKEEKKQEKARRVNYSAGKSLKVLLNFLWERAVHIRTVQRLSCARIAPRHDGFGKRPALSPEIITTIKSILLAEGVRAKKEDYCLEILAEEPRYVQFTEFHHALRMEIQMDVEDIAANMLTKFISEQNLGDFSPLDSAGLCEKIALLHRSLPLPISKGRVADVLRSAVHNSRRELTDSIENARAVNGPQPEELTGLTNAIIADRSVAEVLLLRAAHILQGTAPPLAAFSTDQLQTFGAMLKHQMGDYSSPTGPEGNLTAAGMTVPPVSSRFQGTAEGHYPGHATGSTAAGTFSGRLPILSAAEQAAAHYAGVAKQGSMMSSGAGMGGTGKSMDRPGTLSGRQHQQQHHQQHQQGHGQTGKLSQRAGGGAGDYQAAAAAAEMNFFPEASVLSSSSSSTIAAAAAAEVTAGDAALNRVPGRDALDALEGSGTFLMTGGSSIATDAAIRRYQQHYQFHKDKGIQLLEGKMGLDSVVLSDMAARSVASEAQIKSTNFAQEIGVSSLQKLSSTLSQNLSPLVALAQVHPSSSIAGVLVGTGAGVLPSSNPSANTASVVNGAGTHSSAGPAWGPRGATAAIALLTASTLDSLRSSENVVAAAARAAAISNVDAAGNNGGSLSATVATVDSFLTRYMERTSAGGIYTAAAEAAIAAGAPGLTGTAALKPWGSTDSVEGGGYGGAPGAALSHALMQREQEKQQAAMRSDAGAVAPELYPHLLQVQKDYSRGFVEGMHNRDNSRVINTVIQTAISSRPSSALLNVAATVSPAVAENATVLQSFQHSLAAFSSVRAHTGTMPAYTHSVTGSFAPTSALATSGTLTKAQQLQQLQQQQQQQQYQQQRNVGNGSPSGGGGSPIYSTVRSPTTAAGTLELTGTKLVQGQSVDQMVSAAKQSVIRSKLLEGNLEGTVFTNVGPTVVMRAALRESADAISSAGHAYAAAETEAALARQKKLHNTLGMSDGAAAGGNGGGHMGQEDLDALYASGSIAGAMGSFDGDDGMLMTMPGGGGGGGGGRTGGAGGGMSSSSAFLQSPASGGYIIHAAGTVAESMKNSMAGTFSAAVEESTRRTQYPAPRVSQMALAHKTNPVSASTLALAASNTRSLANSGMGPTGGLNSSGGGGGRWGGSSMSSTGGGFSSSMRSTSPGGFEPSGTGAGQAGGSGQLQNGIFSITSLLNGSTSPLRGRGKKKRPPPLEGSLLCPREEFPAYGGLTGKDLVRFLVVRRQYSARRIQRAWRLQCVKYNSKGMHFILSGRPTTRRVQELAIFTLTQFVKRVHSIVEVRWQRAFRKLRLQRRLKAHRRQMLELSDMQQPFLQDARRVLEDRGAAEAAWKANMEELSTLHTVRTAMEEERIYMTVLKKKLPEDWIVLRGDGPGDTVTGYLNVKTGKRQTEHPNMTAAENAKKKTHRMAMARLQQELDRLQAELQTEKDTADEVVTEKLQQAFVCRLMFLDNRVGFTSDMRVKDVVTARTIVARMKNLASRSEDVAARLGPALALTAGGAAGGAGGAAANSSKSNNNNKSSSSGRGSNNSKGGFGTTATNTNSSSSSSSGLVSPMRPGLAKGPFGMGLALGLGAGDAAAGLLQDTLLVQSGNMRGPKLRRLHGEISAAAASGSGHNAQLLEQAAERVATERAAAAEAAAEKAGEAAAALAQRKAAGKQPVGGKAAGAGAAGKAGPLSSRGRDKESIMSRARSASKGRGK